MTDTQLIKKSIVFRAKYRFEQGPGPTYRLLPHKLWCHTRATGARTL